MYKCSCVFYDTEQLYEKERFLKRISPGSEKFHSSKIFLPREAGLYTELLSIYVCIIYVPIPTPSTQRVIHFIPTYICPHTTLVEGGVEPNSVPHIPPVTPTRYPNWNQLKPASRQATHSCSHILIHPKPSIQELNRKTGKGGGEGEGHVHKRGYHPGVGGWNIEVITSPFLTIYLSIYSYIYPFIYLSIYLSICLSTYLSIYLYIYISILTWPFVNGPKRNCPYLYLQKTWWNLLSKVIIDSWLTSCRFTAMYAYV